VQARESPAAASARLHSFWCMFEAPSILYLPARVPRTTSYAAPPNPRPRGRCTWQRTVQVTWGRRASRWTTLCSARERAGTTRRANLREPAGHRWTTFCSAPPYPRDRTEHSWSGAQDKPADGNLINAASSSASEKSKTSPVWTPVSRKAAPTPVSRKGRHHPYSSVMKVLNKRHDTGPKSPRD
jgi:hypothetical protein